MNPRSGSLRVLVVLGVLVLMVVLSPALSYGATTFSGTVTNSITGEPVPDAEVELWSYDEIDGWVSLDMTTTGPTGVYFFESSLEIGVSYSVDVIARGFESYISDVVDVIPYDGTPLVCDVQLVPFADVVTGTVTNAVTTDPVEGAEAVLYTYDEVNEWVQISTGLTDADRYYECEANLEIGAFYSVDVYADGFEAYISEVPDLVQYTGEALVFNVVLTPSTATGSASGAVRDADTFELIAGVDVALEGYDPFDGSWWELDYVTTGTDGLFGSST